jgi:hypothetical protein
VTDDKSPAEQFLDVFFYAPLGFLMNIEEVLPQLVAKGRREAKVARMFGQYAVRKGGAKVEKAVARMQGGAATAGRAAAPPSEVPDEAEGADVAGDERRPEPTRMASPASSAALAIPDYDSLSASQVVPRLAGLSIDELEAVRSYEAAHRGRKTILGRVAQLQTG